MLSYYIQTAKPSRGFEITFLSLVFSIVLFFTSSCGCRNSLAEGPETKQGMPNSSLTATTLSSDVQAGKPSVKLMVDQPMLYGDNQAFNLFLINHEKEPCAVEDYSLALTLEEEGKGTKLSYPSTENKEEKYTTTHEKLSFFTAQSHLKPTEKVAIPITIHPHAGVQKVIITATLHAQGSTRRKTITWYATPIDSEMIEAASGNGYEELYSVLNDLQAHKNPTDQEKTLALCQAITLDSNKTTNRIVKVLLKIPGLNVNAKNKEGNTPLHIAVKNNNLTAVKLLLKQQANIGITNQEGQTAFNIALHGGTPYKGIINALSKAEKKKITTQAKLSTKSSPQSSPQSSPGTGRSSKGKSPKQKLFQQLRSLSSSQISKKKSPTKNT